MTQAELAASALAAFRCPYRNTILRGLIWAFTGISYGFVFVYLYFALKTQMPMPWLLLVVGMGAGGSAALIYGSLRLTLLSGIYAGVSATGYLLYSRSGADLTTLLPLGALMGSLIGAAYGRWISDTRIGCAEAKIMSGTLAGALAASPFSLLYIAGLEFTPIQLVLVLCPMTGIFYVSTVRAMINSCSHLLGPGANGAIIGLVVGVIASLTLWVIFSSLYDGPPDARLDYANHIMDHWPTVVATASISGFLVGIIRARLGIKWLDI